MGMGGTLEFISCGLPIVTWPHAEDQPYNAACIIENKAGVPLWTKERAEVDYNKINTFLTPIFDAQKITDTFNEILKNPVYRENMAALKLKSMT